LEFKNILSVGRREGIVLADCEGTSDPRLLTLLGCREAWNWWDVCMVTNSQSDSSVQNLVLFNDAFLLLFVHKILMVEGHLCVWKAGA